MRHHASRPYNPNIVNTFFRAGDVEVLGRGIQKICEACGELGASMPEYEITSEFITISLKALNSKKRDVGLENKILSIIRSNPQITQKEIAIHLSVTERIVQRIFKKLSKDKTIERIGGKRFGQWIIKK